MRLGTVVLLAAVGFAVYLYMAEEQRVKEYWQSLSPSETSQQKDSGIEFTEEASMGVFSEPEICKSAVSAMFFQSPSIMKSSEWGEKSIKISYHRPNDNSLWEYKCQVQGNRVYWGATDGRWRNHSADSVVLFMALGENLTIQEDHNDGSASVTHFEKLDDGSIVEVES